MAQAEVYEVATFYAHFDVVKEGETPPPPLTVRVCDSLSCALAGAERLLADLQARLGAGVRVVRAPCVGRCHAAPAADVGHHFVDHADARAVAAAIARTGTIRSPGLHDFDAYRADGGYQMLERCAAAAQPRPG